MPSDLAGKRWLERCLLRISCYLAALLPLAIFADLEAFQSAVSQFPQLRDPNPIIAGESWVYKGRDGEIVSLARTESVGGRTEITMRVISAKGVARVSHAVILTDSPFTLIRAGGVLSTSKSSVFQMVTRDSKSGIWSHGLLRQGLTSGVEERKDLPRPPATELSLITALCAVAWEFGYEFSIPILWNLDRDVVEARVLVRAHVLCTGRETVDVFSGKRSCWRVVIESQGSETVLRRVCWISAKAPYELVRLEDVDETALVLEESSVGNATTEDTSDRKIADQPADRKRK